MPSDEEIRRVKRLIERVRVGFDDLTDQERAEVQRAIAIVRRSRATMLGMPRPQMGTPGTAAGGSA